MTAAPVRSVRRFLTAKSPHRLFSARVFSPANPPSSISSRWVTQPLALRHLSSRTASPSPAPPAPTAWSSLAPTAPRRCGCSMLLRAVCSRSIPSLSLTACPKAARAVRVINVAAAEAEALEWAGLFLTGARSIWKTQHWPATRLLAATEGVGNPAEARAAAGAGGGHGRKWRQWRRSFNWRRRRGFR